MDEKLSTLERNLSESKKREKLLKERVSVWRTRALADRQMLRVMALQYERIIRLFQKNIEDFKKHAFKLFVVSLHERYKNWREGVKK